MEEPLPVGCNFCLTPAMEGAAPAAAPRAGLSGRHLLVCLVPVHTFPTDIGEPFSRKMYLQVIFFGSLNIGNVWQAVD